MSQKEQKNNLWAKLLVLEQTLVDLVSDFHYVQALYQNYANNELNVHWLYIRYSLFRLVIIDVAKIFSEKNTQPASIFRFPARMDGGDFKKIAFPKERVAHYRQQLEIHKTTIKGIEKARDQLIAHTDILFGLAPNQQFFTEVPELIVLGYDFVNECRTSILDKPLRPPVQPPPLTGFLPEKPNIGNQ